MNREVAVYLDQLKKEVSTSTATTRSAGRARLIFALDATASRQPTWDQACHITGTMFEAVVGLGSLDVQLVFYRGYGECKTSKWVTTASELHRLMRPVTCVGGQTQIERVFEHAIRETEKRRVVALIFIGDAMEENGDRLCHLAGKLGRFGTPLFILHEGHDRDATAWFKELCRLTRGAYLAFELGSINRLKTLLGGIATYAVGGYTALAAYGQKHPNEARQITAQLRGSR